MGAMQEMHAALRIAIRIFECENKRLPESQKWSSGGLTATRGAEFRAFGILSEVRSFAQLHRLACCQ